MAWIEFHDGLRNHPKLIELCSELKIERAQALGHLGALWTWALVYAEDGDLGKWSIAVIEEACYWKGEDGKLYTAFLDKFIDTDKKIHDWLDYADRYLEGKYRTSNPQKLAAIRALYGIKPSKAVVGLKNKSSQSLVRQKGVCSLTPTLTNLPLPTHLNLPTYPKNYSELFEVLWILYPMRNGRKLGKAEAFEKFLNVKDEDIPLLFIAVLNLAKSDELPKDLKRFIKNSKGEPYREWVEVGRATGNSKKGDINERLKEAGLTS